MPGPDESGSSNGAWLERAKIKDLITHELKLVAIEKYSIRNISIIRF